MPGITIAASYGTGGEQVARLVADRLGYRLLDRAISSEVAAQLHVSESEADCGERKPTIGERFLHLVLPMNPYLVDDPEAVLEDNADFREAAERLMHDAVETGAVVLGRAGAVALSDRDDVMRVRLYGSDDERIAFAVANNGVTEQHAREEIAVVDKARATYWQHLYARDIDDPTVYDLQIDAPPLGPEKCADQIVDAFAKFRASAA